MKHKAFGAIDLLIGLVVMSFIFLMSVKAFKGASSINIKNSTIEQQSVQDHVDETVDEIEHMRQETINYNKQLIQENY